MKKLLAILVMVGAYLGNSTYGAISITNFSITSSSLSFNITGSFPSPQPFRGFEFISFVNPNIYASPGYALDYSYSSTQSFSGTPVLTDWSFLYAVTRTRLSLDCCLVDLGTNFQQEQTVNGKYDFTWSAAVFDPSAVSSLDVYWGAASLDINELLNSGIYLTTVILPEPSSLSLLVIGGVVLALRGRR